MEKSNRIQVALVDDHVLLRNALATLIDSFEDCIVIAQADNGRSLIEVLERKVEPDVILLDLNMPEIDGYDTAIWLQKNFPKIHVLMLTMYDSELLIIRLLQAGVKGFLRKDIHPSELRYAIQSVVQSGYYYSHYASGKLVNLFRTANLDSSILHRSMLTDQEIEFLKNASSEMTYKEIALKMKLTPRSVDTLRDHLFEKLDVKSRVGLVMFAMKKGIVTI